MQIPQPLASAEGRRGGLLIDSGVCGAKTKKPLLAGGSVRPWLRYLIVLGVSTLIKHFVYRLLLTFTDFL